MQVVHILAALLYASCSAKESTSEHSSSCDGSDDCLDMAYSSLLQESVSIHREGILTSDAVQSLRERTNLPLLLGVLAVVVLAAIVYWFIVQPQAAARLASPQGGHRQTLTQRSHTAAALETLMIPDGVEDEETVDFRDDDDLEEDAYCLAIALIIRDLQALAHGKCDRVLRYARLAYSLGLIFFTVSLQIGVLVCTKLYVTPKQVADIRDSYSSYEQAMYGDHSYLNKNGKNRGVSGFFNASAFDSLGDDMQEAICNIPLSQLTFISVVLLVWSVTCFSQLKKCLENFMAVIFFADTINNMSDALSQSNDEVDSEASGSDAGNQCNEAGIDDGIPVFVITGATLQIKVFLTIFVFIPDFCCTSYVLWLGSRWLVATNDFGNIISNAVALEFILMLKVIIYHALASSRNKRDLQHTALKPSWEREPAGYIVYFSTIVWAVLAVLWVKFYINFQQVLPDYKWDVHEVCSPWLSSQLDPDIGSNFF